MGLKKDCTCKIWQVKRNEKYTDVQISVDKKNKQTDAWETDFSGFVRFIGEAHKKIADLPDGKQEKPFKVKAGDFEVTQRYVKDKNTTYTNFVMYDIQVEQGEVKNIPTPNSDGFMNIPSGIDEELPFS